MEQSDDSIWAAFADAVVHLELPTGSAMLRPEVQGVGGAFPFTAAVHIITAYNPGGLASDDAQNSSRHRELGEALNGRSCVPSVGSGQDGSFPEPGYAVLDMGLEDAVAVGREFGQLAIYRWTPDALVIVGLDHPVEIRLGWSLG